MNHKTSSVYGHSTLTLNKDVVQIMKTYRDLIRLRILKRKVKITEPQPKSFFLTDEGHILSGMRYYMQELWRKVAVTKIHLSHPSKK